jgi:hypothetical protein
MQIPEPFDEESVENKFWQEEEFDDVLPPPGWITDFVLYYRGHEAPTMFCTWAAIGALSMLLKRDASWSGLHFPNFYITLVCDPRLNAKSWIINQAEKVWRTSFEYMDELTRVRKITPVLHSKATIESISHFFQAREEEVKLPNGTIQTVKKGTEVAFVISELATLLGKQSYNEGQIAKLTDLYDCREFDDDTTISRGRKEMTDIYVTILGGSTRTNLEKMIPQEAFQTGFMSRLIIAEQEEKIRAYPHPRSVIGGPTFNTLASRLAYIGEKSEGIYEFTPEADEVYQRWYKRWFMTTLPNKPGIQGHMLNRFDVHLLKLATIIRAQRYELGTDIDVEDFESARKILEATYHTNYDAVKDVGSSPIQKSYNTIERKLQREGSITRKKLLQFASAYGILSDDVTRILYQLHDEGKITIFIGKQRQRHPSRRTEERYIYE